MGATGISKNKWQDVDAQYGYELIPPGTGYPFEITDVREGFSEAKEEEYVQFRCDTTDEDGKSHIHWEFFGLTENRLGFIKGFLLGIGRGDMMASDEIDWSDAKGTEFKGDITHRKVKGEMRANLGMRTLVPVSHDFTEIPEEEEEKRPAPARSPRGRAGSRG